MTSTDDVQDAEIAKKIGISNIALGLAKEIVFYEMPEENGKKIIHLIS